MGMTGDYRVAIEEGATIVRVGTGVFGERSYAHDNGRDQGSLVNHILYFISLKMAYHMPLDILWQGFILLRQLLRLIYQ